MSEYIYWSDSGDVLANSKGEISLPREKVIRCKDCVYYMPNTYSCFTCEMLTFHVGADDFCAWGERKAVDDA